MTGMVDDRYGRWPLWSMTCVVNDLCGRHLTLYILDSQWSRFPTSQAPRKAETRTTAKKCAKKCTKKGDKAEATKKNPSQCGFRARSRQVVGDLSLWRGERR